MKLTKYLADYLEHEISMNLHGMKLEKLIQEGIEAYMSTEDRKFVMLNEAGLQDGHDEVILSVHCGCVQLHTKPAGIKVILHDYDIMPDYFHTTAQSADIHLIHDETGWYEVYEL